MIRRRRRFGVRAHLWVVFAAALPLVLASSSPSSTRFVRAGEAEPIPAYNWYPGYYVLNHTDSVAAKRTVLSDPRVKPFTGVQFRYHWAASELRPGDYSAGFASLDADLRRVAASGKKILVMLMYKKFDGTSTVPADLRQAPGPWCNGPYCGELTNGAGTSVALLWNPVVQARLNAWITAMARHLSESRYVGSVAGIVFNETALGTTDRSVLASAGYNPDAYIQALKDNMRAAITAAPRLITILYFEGGFTSMDDTPVNAGEKIGEWMLLNPRTGVGTPDLQPKDPKGTNHPCAKSKYHGRIVCAPAVQAPDYSTDVTDSFEQSFRYATDRFPAGLGASFLTFSYAVGSGPNAFSFTDVSREIPEHPIPNVARPWPVKPAAVIRKVSLVSPIRPGKVAALTVRVSPRSRCSARFVFGKAASKTRGLGSKSGGKITWRWRVGPSTPPGRWPITVRCGSAMLELTIRILAR